MFFTFDFHTYKPYNVHKDILYIKPHILPVSLLLDKSFGSVRCSGLIGCLSVVESEVGMSRLGLTESA